jgi:hypothetical protein
MVSELSPPFFLLLPSVIPMSVPTYNYNNIPLRGFCFQFLVWTDELVFFFLLLLQALMGFWEMKWAWEKPSKLLPFFAI